MTRRNRKHLPNSGSYLSMAERRRLREISIEKIAALLAEESLPSGEIAQRIGMKPTTVYAHLKYMAGMLQLVRKSGRLDSMRRELWELGTSTAVADDNDKGSMPRRRVGPARQVGMRRDSLVEALFGAAAQGVAA